MPGGYPAEFRTRALDLLEPPLGGTTRNRSLARSVAASSAPSSPILRRAAAKAPFTGWVFTRRAKASGLVPPMGSVGDAYDSAMIASFWSRVQVELANALWSVSSPVRNHRARPTSMQLTACYSVFGPCGLGGSYSHGQASTRPRRSSCSLGSGMSVRAPGSHHRLFRALRQHRSHQGACL